MQASPNALKSPKALEVFKGEDHGMKWKLEKHEWERAKAKLETMASPPWVLKTKPTDVICPITFALHILPVPLGSQCKESKMDQVA